MITYAGLILYQAFGTGQVCVPAHPTRMGNGLVLLYTMVANGCLECQVPLPGFVSILRILKPFTVMAHIGTVRYWSIIGRTLVKHWSKC